MSFLDNNGWNGIRDRRSWSIGHETEEHLICNLKTPGFVRIEFFFFFFFFFFKLWDPLWGSRYAQPSCAKESQICNSPSWRKGNLKHCFSCCFKLSDFWESGTLKKKYPMWVCFLFFFLVFILKIDAKYT